MNQTFKSDRSAKAAQKSVTSLQGDISRHVGNMRAMTLENIDMNTDQILGAASAVQESINKTFGQTEHDAQVGADRKSYELKDNVLDMWGKTKNASKRT